MLITPSVVRRPSTKVASDSAAYLIWERGGAFQVEEPALHTCDADVVIALLWSCPLRRSAR